MKTNEIKELMKLIEKSPIDVLKLEKNDFKLYYQKENASNFAGFEQQVTQVERDVVSNESIVKKEDVSTDVDDDLHEIKSPMIGSFYSRPNPDAEPFVQIGTIVEKDQPVCILEAMKLLNEVPSDVDGEIVEILVEDGDIIEFGQPLFVVKARN